MTALGTLTIALLLLALPGLTIASPFQAENCQLPAPPTIAGDSIAHSVVARIYPRTKDIGAGYSGCQTTWVPAKAGWTVVGVTYFENGIAVSFWAPPPEELLCQYRSGKPEGPHAANCPVHSVLKASSMAPGCGKKILGRGGTSGCQYE